jgi:hypothetical protein
MPLIALTDPAPPSENNILYHSAHLSVNTVTKEGDCTMQYVQYIGTAPVLSDFASRI